MVAASARNISWLVHELLTQPDGMLVSDVKSQLGIADRTYRKYRAYLQAEFEPFLRDDGSSRVIEVPAHPGRRLRLEPR